MTLETLWDDYRAGKPVSDQAEDALSLFYSAVLAFSRGEYELAASRARDAAKAAPASRVYREGALCLADVARNGTRDIYLDPEGFAAFIRGGGNIPLYRSLIEALRECYEEHPPAWLLDIGVGDGRTLLPALTPDVGHTDVVEPSPMLETAAEALRRQGRPHRALHGTVQDLLDGAGPWPADQRWSLVQSTFTLHNLPPDERAAALRWLRQHTDRLLIAEFDVPDHTSCEPDWFEHVVTRYEFGLAEYDEAPVVRQGFLMPVMFGYFDPAHAHYEQPAAAWSDDLQAAGFETVEISPLYDYWWAPALLISAA